MTPAIEFTSVPPWAVAPRRADADVTGRYWTVIAFAGGEPTADEWIGQIRHRHPDAGARVHRVGDDDAARAALEADVATARVGWRLLIAGPADACLRLRARALRLGIGDDEITVASTDVADRDVHCAHCRTVTHATVPLGGVLDCHGCRRPLAVQAHVSRRLGAHLGVLA
ncbi:dimethylamine monooxygenase subunit DmmA family protein [Mycobacterium yunnanensis]|uniref:dimethylamine monooxygenase subunit DmmA family protein n=1 Tax=Mycobacterium yunnanensis TaxID=368477 RepID=UPI0021F37885|nr:dimethylamine monooxygenase subunit DmmA family protein [Mycobacterium yunnanensis]